MFYTNQTIQAVLARAEVPALAAKAVWFVATVALLALIVPVVRRAEPALALVDRRRVRAAGEPDVVVAPLGVDRAGAAGGRRGGGPAALARLGGGRRGAGRDRSTSPRSASCRTSRTRSWHWTAAQQVVGATYVIVGILALVAVRLAMTRRDRAPVAVTR